MAGRVVGGAFHPQLLVPLNAHFTVEVAVVDFAMVFRSSVCALTGRIVERKTRGPGELLVRLSMFSFVLYRYKYLISCTDMNIGFSAVLVV